MSKKDLLVWLMIVAIIALSIYVLYWTKSESFKCVSNPYTYSIKLLEKANSADVSCSCIANTKPVSTSILLTRDGFQRVDQIGGSGLDGLGQLGTNLTNLENLSDFRP